MFSDGPKKLLEVQLNDVMVALVKESVSLKAAREVARLRQIKEAKADEIRWKREERERQEAKELQVLEEEVSLWERAERIRAYMHAVQARVEVSGEEPSSELLTWLGWAKRQADSLDPLCDARDSEPEETLPYKD